MLNKATSQIIDPTTGSKSTYFHDRTISSADAEAQPLLSDRIGEDVCEKHLNPPWWYKLNFWPNKIGNTDEQATSNRIENKVERLNTDLEPLPPLKADTTDKSEERIPDEQDDCSISAQNTAVVLSGCVITFESGFDILSDRAQDLLNRSADILLDNRNVVIEVQGHTDSLDSTENNLELSKKRTLAVARYLMLRGVPQEQVSARAFGDSMPAHSNDTAEGRRRNNRVEFQIRAQ